MKVKHILFPIIILCLFFLPLLKPSVANEKPSYIGINENDVFIWKVSIDEGPYEKYLEDLGYSDDEIDNETDLLFDDVWEEDVKGWKIIILDVKDEKKFDYNGNENHQVPYYFNWYITEDENAQDWEIELENGLGGIAKYDVDYYVYRSSVMMGLLKDWQSKIAKHEVDSYVYKSSIMIGLYYSIVANNINWDRVANKLNDELNDKWDGFYEDAGADVETTQYFFTAKENGISTFWNADDYNLWDFKATTKYNDDGVMMYYKLAYAGDSIIELELEERFFYENWWILLIITIIGIVTLVAIGITFLYQKKQRGRKSSMQVEKTPERIEQTQTPPQLLYCPNCGTRNVTRNNFCIQCGQFLKIGEPDKQI